MQKSIKNSIFVRLNIGIDKNKIMSTEQEIIKKNEEEYSASNIQVLEGLEAVRKRPAMYIGDIGEKGLHHLVYEVVDNSIDEALAGYCDSIEVTINEDNSITVKDNGRGIPTDFHEKEGKSALEVVLTVLHAGGKFDKGSYKVSGGLHGVGVSCVNALSTLLIAEIHRGGKIYKQSYSQGVPTSKVDILGECEDRGTSVTFKPDPTIFTHTTEYKYEILAKRLRELAFLNKGIHLTLTDKRVKDEESGEYMSEHFYSKEGLKEFVQYLDTTRGEPIIENIIYIETEKNGLLTCIITPFVALAIKIDSPGPVFFSQTRIGKNGRRFKIWKFRSMYIDAEERKKELQAQNEIKGLMFKMEHDPRITRVGDFIRKTSIDETPQFFNIFLGDMSLVGTRPPTEDEFEKYNGYYRRRMSITPGLTGMWQVSGRSDIQDFEEIVKLDLEYIDNWSLTLDLKILFQKLLKIK